MGTKWILEGLWVMWVIPGGFWGRYRGHTGEKGCRELWGMPEITS